MSDEMSLVKRLRADAVELQIDGVFTETADLLIEAADALERRWQPIESAPKSGGAILVYQPWKSGYDTVMIGHYANGWVWQDASKDGEMWDIHPTHWMPLPPPPAKRD